MYRFFRTLATVGIFLVLLISNGYANVLSAYYGPDGLSELQNGRQSGDALKKTIARLASHNKKVLGYTTAKKYLFGKVYLEKSGNSYILKDVYCRRVLRSDQGWNIGPMKIPPNGEVNCEHTWPQSRFNTSQSKSAQKSDLHHLFPTDSKANGVRGNYPFGEVSGKIAHAKCKSSYIGSALEPAPDYNQRLRYFEPPQEQRGNTARALFYFSVMYKLPIGETEEAYLRRWNKEDPVDAEEIRRNGVIMEIQGNRNPFIDFPELVDRVADF
jgi:endonuclease I